MLPAHRGRGLGRHVWTAALQAAEASDPELVFIVADREDWPRELYAKLGFAPMGTFHLLTREQDLPLI